MLTVHHLNQSRSQRVLWALEELQLPYQIVRYQREKTMLAPAALKKIHPLGKSPVLEDNGYVLAESGAILEYLQETWDSGGMPLLLMKLVFASLGKPPVPFGVRSLGSLLGKGIQKTWLDPQLATHARFIDDHLAARPWFAGERLSMADIQMSFPVMALLARGGMHDLVHIEAWRQRVEQRPAWQRAIERGGPFTLPGA
ncbi:glutathione S-transferase [Klebsiella pneumoniae]|uniref:glutathione S-transferase family protein n=1 Tax=Klebsiella pneumoniae TaxID=573 RepID=UPI002875C9D7|nr:glutathione S-transferase [Klebsiella pneumoniae]MDS1350316.1 glutathione S-transferase [Klebsiella pneumoniae]